MTKQTEDSTSTNQSPVKQEAEPFRLSLQDFVKELPKGSKLVAVRFNKTPEVEAAFKKALALAG